MEGIFEPPMLHRKHSIVILDGVEMVGLLNLGELEDGKININFTAVKSNYRRRGLSMILKIKAFQLAKEYGAEFLTTQNHYLNPMLQINKKLGFVEDAIDLSFQKNVNQTHIGPNHLDDDEVPFEAYPFNNIQ